MNRISIIYIVLLLLASCAGNSNNVETSEKQITSENYLMLGDSLVNRSIRENKVIVYVKTDGKYTKVKDNKWPDEIETTYNVITDSIVRIYIEVPYSESGDWNNTYTYYYDSEGLLRVSKVVSTFFNSICYDGVLTETTVKIYDKNCKVLSNSYSLVDDKMNAIKDASKCVFNYRDSIPLYTAFKEIPLIQSEWK